MMKLIIFDDEAAIGRLVVRVATVAGIAAVAVTDPEAFASQLASDHPEIILLDLQLGCTDGIEQLKFLKKQQYTGAVVLMSGFDTRVLSTARELALNLGLTVEGVLPKPLQLSDLEQIFARLQSTKPTLTVAMIRPAIANGEMILEFQPVVTRNPKTLVKLEALIRWVHPVAGLISPSVFVPMAESDTDTINGLTEWVLHAAVEAYQILAQIGISVPLAVNFSAQDLGNTTWPERIQDCLAAGAMPSRHLCIELTETSAFHNSCRTMEVLSRLRLKNIQVAIDDFGTGFSSLKLLRQMPFSEIKVDRSFVGDLTTSRDSQAIVKSIAGLALHMGMACVAEGVETAAAADMLEQLGIHMLQGYLIARPMPAEAIAAWFAIWSTTGTTKPFERAMSGAPNVSLQPTADVTQDFPASQDEQQAADAFALADCSTAIDCRFAFDSVEQGIRR